MRSFFFLGSTYSNLVGPALSVAVPSFLPESLKVTVPVGVPPEDEVTCAVNVTTWFTNDGLTEELSVVVVEIALDRLSDCSRILPA